MKGRIWRQLGVVLTASAGLVLSACASSAPSGDPTPLSGLETRYLRSPLLDVPVGVPFASSLGPAYDAMLMGSSTVQARRVASEVLTLSPETLPARLLLAQADFVDGRFAVARERLDPWVREHRDYFPATLLWARLAELDGDVVSAYEAYRAISSRTTAAAAAAADLKDGATEEVLEALRGSAGGLRAAAARRYARLLEEWSPSSDAAHEAKWRVAQATGDALVELEALRELASSGFSDPRWVERRAELELTDGDAQVALRMFEDLVAEDPGDSEKMDNLARARFRWRLQVLPEDVVVLTEAAELTRADFAALLYWLVPGVRGGAPGSGRIATDILDLPTRRRREIARVVNRELMGIDPIRHRFYPARSLTRAEALAGLLEVFSQDRPRSACVSLAAGISSLSVAAICEYAARCGLLSEVAACLPEATVSGQDTQQLLRRGLVVLSEGRP